MAGMDNEDDALLNAAYDMYEQGMDPPRQTSDLHGTPSAPGRSEPAGWKRPAITQDPSDDNGAPRGPPQKQTQRPGTSWQTVSGPNNHPMPYCECAVPASWQTSPDKPGKRYYSCGSDPKACDWTWVDELGSKGNGPAVGGSPLQGAPQNFASDGGVNCVCGQPANRHQANTEKNKGRWFYKCPKQPEAEKCKFFKWEDELGSAGTPPGRTPGFAQLPSTSPGQPLYGNRTSQPIGNLAFGGNPFPGISSYQQPPSQQGGNPYAGASTYQQGPGANPYAGPSTHQQGSGGNPYGGASAYQQGSNTFPAAMQQQGSQVPAGNVYQPGSGGQSGGGPGGSVGSDVCFKCKQPGHWSSQCPNQSTAAPSGDRSCFNCKQLGHWAKDCPTKAAGGGGGGGGSGECFNCHQTGHWAKDCPQKQGGSAAGGGYGGGSFGGYGGGAKSGTCRKCGQTGHWAAQCPVR